MQAISAELVDQEFEQLPIHALIAPPWIDYGSEQPHLGWVEFESQSKFAFFKRLGRDPRTRNGSTV